MELIGNGKSYKVPPYQRDYSWSEEQWEDLWNDIVELRSNAQDHHYMGALVIEGKTDRESSANKEIRNAAYDEKIDTYKNSTYALTKEIPEIAPEEWTPELVNKRQQQLAARATHLWRSDFA